MLLLSKQKKIKEEYILKVNKMKLKIAMARSKMNASDLSKKALMPLSTVSSVISGSNARSKTLGKIAAALDVDVTEIIDMD